MGGGISKMVGGVGRSIRRGVSRGINRSIARGIRGIRGITKPFTRPIHRGATKSWNWIDKNTKHKGDSIHWSSNETQWSKRLSEGMWDWIAGNHKDRYKSFEDDINDWVDVAFSHQGVRATWAPSHACRAYGGPFMLMDSKSAMIIWIVMQVLIVPVCLFVIMLGGAPNAFPCLSGRVVPAKTGEEGIAVKDLVAVTVDGPVGLMRRKSRDRAIIATVFMVVALILLVLQGFAIGASRFCANGVDFAMGLVEKEVVGGEKSAFWALPYGLFALVSCGLTLVALLSTVKSWRGYAALRKVERDLLEIEQAGDEAERNEAFET